MPANLTPQYLDAEKRFKEAQNPEERIVAIREMMAIIPKHKGTEKLRGELKRKLSLLQKESTRKKSLARKNPFHVNREGARQLAVVGAPNSGKSSIVARLTNASPEVADYPFTTRTPTSGMLVYQDVQLQLVDLPAVSIEHMESWIPQVIQAAEAMLWIVDLSDDGLVEAMQSTMEILEKRRIGLGARQALIIANKSDASGAKEREDILREFWEPRFEIVSFSALDGSESETEALGRRIYEFLHLVRVYTKTPGDKPERKDPFVLAEGSTILDLAGAIHKDLQERLKFARVWSAGRPEGLRVSRDFVLTDGDIVELHAA